MSTSSQLTILSDSYALRRSQRLPFEVQERYVFHYGNMSQIAPIEAQGRQDNRHQGRQPVSQRHAEQ